MCADRTDRRWVSVHRIWGKQQLSTHPCCNEKLRMETHSNYLDMQDSKCIHVLELALGPSCPAFDHE
jgi:hypothetical protein